LIDKILDQSAHGIVGKCSDDRAAQPEAAPQPARDVVFATAFPNSEVARRGDPRVARI
jgi:hypothetical protein